MHWSSPADRQRAPARLSWTFRAEDVILLNEFDSSADLAAYGDLTNRPDLRVAAVAALLAVPEPQTYALVLAGLAGVL
jgi:hypothetical protein